MSKPDEQRVVILPAGVTVVPTGDVHATEVANAVNRTLQACMKALRDAGVPYEVAKS